MDHQRAATHYQLLAVGVLNAVGKIFNNTQCRKKRVFDYHDFAPGCTAALYRIKPWTSCYCGKGIKVPIIKRADKSKSLIVCKTGPIQTGVATDCNIRWGRVWRDPALLVSPALVFLSQVINNDQSEELSSATKKNGTFHHQQQSLTKSISFPEPAARAQVYTLPSPRNSEVTSRL